MPMATTTASMQMDPVDPIYSALDGALVIYAADAAAQTGPGMGAGGSILGLEYDQDFVMLITGAQADAMDMSGMSGMSGMVGMSGMGGMSGMTDMAGMSNMSDMGSMAGMLQSHVLLVGGFLPDRITQGTATLATLSRQDSIATHYRPFLPQASAGAHRVLVRVLNLSGLAQPVAAVTKGYPALAYQVHQLEWTTPAVDGALWMKDRQPDADLGNLMVQPGEAFDVVLDLDASLPVGSTQAASVAFVTTAPATSATAPVVNSMNMTDRRSGSMTPAGTMMGSMMQCPRMGRTTMDMPEGGPMCGGMMGQ
jgi:hypothetical protein